LSDQLALIIEDSQTQALILAEALRAAGFETEIISTGDAAIERLAAVVPDIVVLDLHLPGVSGTDILRHIRAEARLDQTRVIVVTVESQAADIIRDEADLVLLKPVDFGQLRDLAARLGAINPRDA
jgi:two-component system phosphate regulon response regulator PhoB